MTKHLQRELDLLKKSILNLCKMVTTAVKNAEKAINEKDTELANKVITADRKVDEMEIEIEEDCLKLLALHQPVAIDLRFIIAVLKMNNDLERIGDLAVSLAKKAIHLAAHPQITPPVDFTEMFKKSLELFNLSIESMVSLNTDLAWEVCKKDDEVDTLKKELQATIHNEISVRPHAANLLTVYLGICRHTERIADHATNIAEDVIYLVNGEIIRHSQD